MIEHDIKKTTIYDMPKKVRWEYELIGDSQFSLPFSDEIAEQIVNLYAEYSGGPVYNGPTICLEDIEDISEYTIKMKVSRGRFYDFLLANIIGREAQNPKSKIIRSFAAAGASPDVLSAVELLGQRFADAKKQIRSFRDCVKQTLLPNAIAVSILVMDSKGGFLVSQRTDNVIIGKRLGGVTATGTLEFMDCVASARKDREIDPFCACAQRELTEESEFKNLPDHLFTTRALFIGHAKLQPIAIVDVQSPLLLKGYRTDEPCGSEEVEPELRKMVAVGKTDLQSLVFKYDMTEASSYHMLMHLYD